MSNPSIASLGFAALVAAASPVLAETPFYAGKRLTTLINYSAGGPADIDGRVFARHIGKHIAGQPVVIVQNMDGAGGQLGVNYLGEVAPKDGTIVGLLTGSSFASAYGAKTSRVDFRSFEFVAAQPSTSVYYMRADVKPGIKTPADFARAEGVIIGGLALESSKDVLLRMALDNLGIGYKYVTSYRGTNAVRLALQQGEVNFTSESPPAYRGVVEPGLVQKGVATGVFYDPGWDGTRFTTPADVEGLGIPSYPEMILKARGSLPAGPLWEAYKTIVAMTGNNYRLIAYPPGAPPAAREALRVAVASLKGDKQFAEDAMKAFGFVPTYSTPADLSEIVRKQLGTTPESKAFVTEYIARVETTGGAGKK